MLSSKLQQGRYATTGKFGAWLVRIAHNVIMDSYRERRSEKVVEPADNNDLSNLGNDELLDTNIECKYVNDQERY